MSAIGRIFLILNLILAAVFLGFASNQLAQKENVSQSLATEKAAHETDKKAAADKEAALNTQVTQLKTELSGVRDDRDKEKLTGDRNGRDLAEEKANNAQLRGELTGIKESLGGYNSTIAALTSQKDRLVTEREEAQAARDAASAEKGKADKARRDAEDALQSANTKIASLEVAVAGEVKNSSKLDTELKALYVLTGHQRIGTPQPLVEGAVVAVNNSIAPGLLAINKGSMDKVIRGYVFDVYNGNVYKGRAQVQTVNDTTCSALMILTVPTAAVSEGDRVTTQL